MNLTDHGGRAPDCQDDCKPTSNGYWADKARISCLDLQPYGSVEQYLRSEDDVTLLTRVAMAENNREGSNGTLDRTYVMWIIKLRMEMGFTNWTVNVKTTLQQEIFYPNQFSTVTGYVPNNQKGMIDVNDPYKAAIGEETTVLEAICGGNINAGIYPCDNSSKPDDPEAVSLKRWIFTYHLAQQVINTSSEQFPQKFPERLKGYDSFRGYETAGSQQFYEQGNHYISADDRDLERIWPEPE